MIDFNMKDFISKKLGIPIEKAFKMEYDNRTYTMNNYSWSAFSKVIYLSIENHPGLLRVRGY